MNDDLSGRTDATGALVFQPIEERRYRCANGHEDTSVITFEIPLGSTPVHVCATCWRDWMIDKGWKAAEVK